MAFIKLVCINSSDCIGIRIGNTYCFKTEKLASDVTIQKIYDTDGNYIDSYNATRFKIVDDDVLKGTCINPTGRLERDKEYLLSRTNSFEYVNVFYKDNATFLGEFSSSRFNIDTQQGSIVEISKTNQTALKNALQEQVNRLLESTKNDINVIETHIDYLLSQLRINYAKRTTLSKTIIEQNSSLNELLSKIVPICEISKVKHATYSPLTKNIYVETHPLYFRTLNGGRFFLGEATIEFNIANGDIKFGSDNKRRSHWGKTCPHPHVSLDGHACLGNTGEIIASLQADKEYALVIEILIAFLEQANTDDCAGKHAMNWDRVDENGAILQEGYMDYNESRFEYGETPDEDEVIDVPCCKHCGREIEEEEDYCINDEWICQCCREDYYTYCNDCCEYVLNDEATYIDSDEIYVCEYCLEHNYVHCDQCNELYHNQNIGTASDGAHICDDCIDEYEDNLREEEDEDDCEDDEEVAVTEEVNPIALRAFVPQPIEQLRCSSCEKVLNPGEETIYNDNILCENCAILTL